MNASVISEERSKFHKVLLDTLLSKDSDGVPSNADKSSRLSREVSMVMLNLIGETSISEKLAGQTYGANFESLCASYLRNTFLRLSGLRPGDWKIGTPRELSLGSAGIAEYEQYQHLSQLALLARSNSELKVAIGADYLIKPDVLVLRSPASDQVINSDAQYVSDEVARLSPLRASNQPKLLMHASVSCKWTMRSDRSQNSRTEALNLIRNRKGKVPHIVVITAEPMPSRISSLALGTGDVDCVYHVALHELRDTMKELDFEDAAESLELMVEGNRLRDISDLPLDLCV